MNTDATIADSIDGAAGTRNRMFRFPHGTLSRSPGMPSRIRRLGVPALVLSLVLIFSSITGCGRKDAVKYEAEKALFNARKLRDDVFRGSIREPFLDRAIQGFVDASRCGQNIPVRSFPDCLERRARGPLAGW